MSEEEKRRHWAMFAAAVMGGEYSAQDEYWVTIVNDKEAAVTADNSARAADMLLSEMVKRFPGAAP